MWKIFFAYVCCVVTFVLCGLIINTIQLLFYYTLRPISGYLYKKINYYLLYTYFAMYIFLVDWYCGCELHLYMDKHDYQTYFGKEHSFLICNHSTEIDWLILLSLAEKAHLLGNSKSFAKNYVQYLPGFGFILYLSDYIYLARNFEKDKKLIEEKVTEIMKYPDPTWIVLYPEGTRFTKLKHENSMDFARKNGLPTLKHHLSPRTKGFTTSLPSLNNNLKAIYDVTLDFKQSDENKPKIFNIIFGKKVKAYFYIRRIPFEDVPKDEEGASKFLHELFVQKDKYRDSFSKHEDFFTKIKVKGVEKMLMSRSVFILINALCWYALTLSLVAYWLGCLILSGNVPAFALCVAIMLTVSYLMNKFVGTSALEDVPVYENNNRKL